MSRYGALAILDEYSLEPGARLPRCALPEAVLLMYVCDGSLAGTGADGIATINRTGEFFLSRPSQSHTRHNPSPSRRAHVFVVGLHTVTDEKSTASTESFYAENRRDRLSFIASPDGCQGSLRIHQDAFVYSSILATGRHVVHEMASSVRAWLHVVRGELAIGEVILGTGDGVGIRDTAAVSFTARCSSEILLTVSPDHDEHH